MKHRLIIFLIFSFILFLVLFPVWIACNVFGSEIKNEKTISLNFDDGPNQKFLKELLPLLEKYDVKANFFFIGSSIISNKQLAKKMSDSGHGIENHSWAHENLKKLFAKSGAEAVEKSLKKTDEIIFSIIGRKPIFFRPPYWEINPEIEKIAQSFGYKVMKLSEPDINTMDYADAAKKRSVETLIERVKRIVIKREKSGIFKHNLVFHELEITAKALKELIPYFQNLGYKFIKTG